MGFIGRQEVRKRLRLLIGQLLAVTDIALEVGAAFIPFPVLLPSYETNFFFSTGEDRKTYFGSLLRHSP
jgi:hypothetical protein